MEVDIDMLQQVEALERKVVSAGLQVKVQTRLDVHSLSTHQPFIYLFTYFFVSLISLRPRQGWMHAAPQSKRPDLVYHEQKLLPSASPDGARRDESQKEAARSVARRPNNPLDIAVGRLAELQRNIEQRCPHTPAPQPLIAEMCVVTRSWKMYFVTGLTTLTLLPNSKAGKRRAPLASSCGTKPSLRFAVQLSCPSASDNCRNPSTGNDPSVSWSVGRQMLSYSHRLLT